MKIINKLAVEDIDLQKKECVVYDVVGLEIKDTNELRLKDINFTVNYHLLKRMSNYDI